MEAKKVGFFDHLEQLRWVLIKCGVAFAIGCAVIGFFLKDVAAILAWPLERVTGEGSDALQGLVTRSPMGVFFVLVQICGLGGLGITLPLMLFWIAGFIAPALTPKEKRRLAPGCFLALCLFLGGALFAYFLLLPTSLMVSAKLNRLLGFELIWSAGSYYGLVVWMTLGVGLICEFPLVLILLVSLGVLSVQQLKQSRRMVLLLGLVIAALATPTGDPLTLLILALPLYGLYELSIHFAGWIERRREVI